MNAANEKSPVRVAMLGAGGRMGRAIMRFLLTGEAPGLQLTGAVDLWDAPDLGRDVGDVLGLEPAGVSLTSDLEAVADHTDVVIDFTSHHGTAGNAPRCAEKGLAMVIGTTGLSDDEMSAVRQAAESIPVMMAANMSLGINLLSTLVERAARALGGYDIEIVERHHRHKKDAPSGTALLLGRAAAEGREWSLDQTTVHGRSGHIDGDRPNEEIAFHAVRGGDIVGDHSVLFAGAGELLELSHRATTRDVFARGALRAAGWVAGRAPDLYSMRDVLGLD